MCKTKRLEKAAFLIASLFLLQGCSDSTYTLYRSSVIDSNGRFHVATFDAKDGESYNSENCQRASKLFKKQPGVLVDFWCEKGQFKK